MDKDIEKLVKIQGAINKNVYHLYIETDLETEYRWVLFLFNPNVKNYFSEYNRPILTSSIDSIDYLVDYLEKHNGFSRY